MEDDTEEKRRKMEGGVDPFSCKMLHLFSKLFQQETLPASPFCVQTHCDWHRKGRLGEDVGKGAAIEVVSQHILGVLIRVQLPSPKHLAEDCLLI